MPEPLTLEGLRQNAKSNHLEIVIAGWGDARGWHVYRYVNCTGKRHLEPIAGGSELLTLDDVARVIDANHGEHPPDG